MAVTKKLWGNHNGQDIYLFTITNGYMELSVSNYGCTITSILLPAGNDGFDNVVLGYDSLGAYLDDPFYMGCVIGRFANRISRGSFKIDGTGYQLTANEINTGNHLHGGHIGFNKKIFSVMDDTTQPGKNSVQFYFQSPDGEEGYPGNLEVFITCSLTDTNEVMIQYKAGTDKTTPVNLTSHCYFNLSGSGTATDHELFINADNVLVADNSYIPTGEIKPVKDTDHDFTFPRPVNNNNGFDGYNDCFVLNDPGDKNQVKAILYDPTSGRKMIVKTSLPGIMFYTGDFLSAPFKKNQGICLEAQYFPDSLNQPHFPSTLVHPGELYQHTTIYQFN